MTPNKEELLRSIRPGMKLDKNFFLRIYGYSITEPGFSERTLSRMEILGCSNARNYYSCIVAENEHEHQKQMKEAAAWHSKELENRDRRKEGGDQWRETRVKLLQKKKELLMLKSQGLTRS